MPPSLNLLLATGNAGKVAEMKTLLADLPVRLRTLDEFPDVPEVVEDRGTLDGNARKKAQTLASFCGLPALADDTGLEVDALDGRPGVRTARFAGDDATDSENRRALLDALDGRAERGAQFRTVVALADPGSSEAAPEEGEAAQCVEGVCRGRIATEERGTGGFGYDAVFAPDEQSGEQREGGPRTFAEMSAEEKNAVSHRRRALDRMRAHLEQRLTELGRQ